MPVFGEYVEYCHNGAYAFTCPSAISSKSQSQGLPAPFDGFLNVFYPQKVVQYLLDASARTISIVSLRMKIAV